jgi:hypothetical protein
MNNYPVWVGQDVYNRRWVRILGTNLEGLTTTTATSGGIIPIDVEPHGSSHYITGSDAVYITTRQVADLLLTVVSGLTVRLAGGFVIADGQPTYIAGQNIDLTSYVPTDACWIVIRANSAGVISVQEGAEVDSFADLTLDSIPAVTAGYSPLWAVRMYGQTTINGSTTQADFFDLRFAPRSQVDNHDHSGDLGDGDTFPVTNLTSEVGESDAADGSVLIADGSGGMAWGVDRIKATAAEVAINDAAGDTPDFRVEGTTEDKLVLVDASADVARIGDGDTNYTQWDKTGHQTMVGTAQPWDDLRVEPVARTTGVNAPTFEKWYDDSGGTSRGVYLYSFDNAIESSQKEIFFTMQLPHSWNQDDVDIHVHWVAESTASDSKVRWGLEYAWAEIGAVFGDTVIVYADTDTESATGTTANEHKVTPFAAISPTTDQDGISSVLIGRLFRNSAADEDTYTGKAGLLYIDAHYQLNSIGSNDEYTK